jgi:hypothetical protein
MFDVPLRILLIIALVTWSPAWCCCALGAAALGDAEWGACSGRWSSMSSDREIVHELPTCCRTRIAAEADEASESEVSNGCCDDDNSRCRCSDRPDELTRLDTAAKITLPTPGCIAAIAITMRKQVADVRSPLFAWPAACHDGAPVAQRTLFALRCMLLT